MKIYDISQEVFSCAVYPGDPKPERNVLNATADGGLYNLTAFSMCAHNGTHIDAPFHFLPEGKTVEQLDLSVFVGDCYLARHSGDVTAADADAVLKKAAGIPRGFSRFIYNGRNAAITAITMAGSILATFTVFPNSRFTPTQKIRILPTRLRFAMAASVITSFRSPAKTVTLP